VSTQPASADQRQAALARQVSIFVAKGRRIEVQNPLDAVLVHGRVLEFRERLTVDEWANVRVEKLPLDRDRLIMLIGAAVVVLAFIVYAIATS
jgi:hypothetical protein